MDDLLVLDRDEDRDRDDDEKRDVPALILQRAELKVGREESGVSGRHARRLRIERMEVEARSQRRDPFQSPTFPSKPGSARASLL